MFLICRASRICSFCLLFWCSNIVGFSVRISRTSVVRHECLFKCCAMELVSERCIVSLLYIYRYPDEPLRRNCSRLVPDSRNNLYHYIYIYITTVYGCHYLSWWVVADQLRHILISVIERLYIFCLMIVVQRRHKTSGRW